MYETLSENLKNLCKACPYPLYVVGGRVRDCLAGFVPDEIDTDICAPATAADFAARARECGFEISAEYKNTGTVKLEKDGESYEFTCFRSDKYVRGRHVPENTAFTDDINLDARRRDFKCNAVYYDIGAKKYVDPLGGIEDIRAKRIDTVAPPEKVFGEDGLRLMRLARISAQTGFTPTPQCMAAARERCNLISDVSAERTAAELKLILHADGRCNIAGAHYRGLEILKDIGVLSLILPELCKGEGIAQREDFHKYDVLEHSLRCVMYAHDSVRLAALLHDVGKPLCFEASGNFIGHEERGADAAAAVMERLKVPKKLAEETERLIRLHMYDFRGDAKENKIRRFIVQNYDIYDKILYLKQADFSACKDDLSEAPTVAKFKRIKARMEAEGAPFTLKELDIKGNELLSMGFPPVSVGQTLSKLLYDCAISEVANDKAALLKRARKVYLNAYLQ